jgi:hypothetical protein
VKSRIQKPAAAILLLSLAASMPAPAHAQPPAPPAGIEAKDRPWDGGATIDVTIQLSPDDLSPQDRKNLAAARNPLPPEIQHYRLEQSGERGGLYLDVANVVPEERDYEKRKVTYRFTFEKENRGEPFYFRARAVAPDGTESGFVQTAEPVRSSRQWFDGGRFWLLVIMLVVCGSVVLFIAQARGGKELKIRKIAGLEAVDEAVGRATEMGRSCLFIPGIQDMNDIQTIAGITILSRVAQVAAQYDAKVEVPTSRSLVMTAARETVQSAFLAAGRPDAYNEDDIYYVTDEQFGYVAYLTGMMVRTKPAACFYLGAFFAESLILAETGNSIDAIQVAGTAQPSQLPFFVAACDYTLIGEEFFAASAYLSGDPDQLGSLKGQDVGKLIVGTLIAAGCLLLTLAAVTGVGWFAQAGEYLRDTVLK